MSDKSQDRQFEDEAQFHDEWADSVDLRAIDMDAFTRSPTALENRHVLKRLGEISGKRILDIGCGLGESSVMLARRGAYVTATDISPRMVEFAQGLAALHNVTLETKVGPAETLDFPENSFDIIYTANTIHHLADKKAFIEAAHRFLKPGGLFVSWDPVKYNPVINIYRRIASGVRTVDECPLGKPDIAFIRSYFRETETTHFWFLALALFIKYYLCNRVDPNKERYWKKIYNETTASLWWWIPLEYMDRLLLKLPLVRWLSWNIVLLARK